MRYFPILGELFASDSVVFLLPGIAIAVLLCLKVRESRGKAALLCLAVYVACEAVSSVPTGSYLPALVLLFAGTVALGGCAGFAVMALIARARCGQA